MYKSIITQGAITDNERNFELAEVYKNPKMTSHTIQLGNISKSQTFFLYWIGKIFFKNNTTREFKENSTLMKVHSSNFFYGPIISDGLIPSLQCRQSIPTTLNEINTFTPKRTEGKAHLRLISSPTFPKKYIYIYTQKSIQPQNSRQPNRKGMLHKAFIQPRKM